MKLAKKIIGILGTARAESGVACGSVLSCRHMHQDKSRGFRTFIPSPQLSTPSVSQPALTTSANAASTDDINRKTYSLTVEGVAALLNTHGIDRDKRTLQRWCKSGKVRAVVDTKFGDRYLVDPASVEDLLPGLVAEENERQKRHAATLEDISRRDALHDATGPFTPRHAVIQEENRQKKQRVDIEFEAAT